VQAIFLRSFLHDDHSFDAVLQCVRRLSSSETRHLKVREIFSAVTQPERPVGH
jgi:hypothetical protein